MSAGTLTNPLKIGALIDTVGDHAKTDIQLNEMQKLARLAKDVKPASIVSRVLDTSPDGLLIDGTGTFPGAGSIELPKAGPFDYSEIHDYVKAIFADHYITDENAKVEVQNATGTTGLAGKVVASLKAAHYNVLDPVTAPNTSAQTLLYDYTGGKKPYTIRYLEQRFGVKAQRATLDPTVVAEGATAPEIRVMIGTDYTPPGQ
jgi:hypothetical protein